MKKYLTLMNKKTKIKCCGVVLLALVSAVLASTWPVRLGELYTTISNGTIRTIAQGAMSIVVFGLIYLSAECIAIVRRVALDCIIASHEAEIRELSIEKLLKMPVSYYSGCLRGEKTAQLNQGVAGFSQLIKIMCKDVFATVLTAICTLVQVFLNAPLVMVGIMLLYLMISLTISVFQIRSQNGIRESIDQKQLTDMLYYTPQTSFFIAGNVRENLKYGLEREVADAELISALQNVHLVGAGHKDTVIRIDPEKAIDCVLVEGR